MVMLGQGHALYQYAQFGSLGSGPERNPWTHMLIIGDIDLSWERIDFLMELVDQGVIFVVITIGRSYGDFIYFSYLGQLFREYKELANQYTSRYNLFSHVTLSIFIFFNH